MKNGRFTISRFGAGQFTLTGIAFAVLLSPNPCVARIAIEDTQREFQGRYYFVLGSYVSWPGCACGLYPAPNFPPTGFYGDLDTDSELALQLVQDLAAKFYGVPYIYSSFVNTPDGTQILA